MAGVSFNTINNWVRQERLHPKKEMRTLANGVPREVKVFDLNELMKIVRRRDPNEIGEVTARAFELFEQGQSLRHIVITLRQSVDKIEELHDRWLSCGGSEFVITPVAYRELERLLGPFDGVADLVQRVVDLVRSKAAESVPE